MLTQHHKVIFSAAIDKVLLLRTERHRRSGYSVDGRFNCHQIVIDEISFDSETESFEIELRRRQCKA